MLKSYGLLSFAKKTSKNISKNISKKLSSIYSKKGFDNAKQPTSDAF